jgi:O-antigen/teichoic acid export membrane protein
MHLSAYRGYWNAVRQWRPGAYAQDGLRLFGWLALRAAAQAAAVLLLARWLGASGYGEFVAALAVAGFFTPLAGLGLGAVLLVRGARAPEQMPALQAQAARLWAISSVAFSLVATAAMSLSLPSPQPLWALAALAFAEVAATSWVELVARSKQARHQAHAFGAIQAGLPLARLAALALALPWVPASPVAWMLIYAAASLIYAVALGISCTGSLHPQVEKTPAELTSTLVREGAPFVVGAASLRIQAEFNKPVLAHLDYTQTGTLGVAQRVVDLVTLPLTALQEALWPRVFGADRPTTRILRTGLLLVLFGLGAGTCVLIVAPLMPPLLGSGYTQTAAILMWLAPLPTVQLTRSLARAALLALGYSGALVGIQLASTLAGVLLTLWLIPSYAIRGAVWAIYGTEIINILLQAIMLSMLLRARNERQI